MITAHAQESGDTSSVLKETQQTILANTDPACVTGEQERCCRVTQRRVGRKLRNNFPSGRPKK